MSFDDTFKITYHLGSQKKVNYVYRSSKNLTDIKSYISNWLFNEIGYPECNIRLFWIDADNDEVDIVNEEDYIFFIVNYPAQPKRLWHLHVASVATENTDKTEMANVRTVDTSSSNATTNQAKVPPADGSYEFAVHENVECDACLMAPIVGFRYKCIQCPNYDLCQNCESKHVHSEHMMVRMPTNNCPNVVETYITGRSSGRKHAKRSKTSCPFVKNGLSVIIDDNSGENSNPGGGENAEPSTFANGKERGGHGRRHHRRHQRHNFLAHLYEMMHDLAEGGGAAAAAHATGEEEASSATKTTTSTSGPQTTTSKITTSSAKIAEAGADIIAAQIAAQQSHESALKAAEIASKVAHETAVKAAKNITESMFAPHTSAASAAQTDTANGKEKDSTKDKADATTSPRDSTNSIPVSPSLEAIAQFLDPQYMKTGIQILNNFSDMFAKMLDPMDNAEEVRSNNTASSCSFNTNLRKNSTTSTKSSVSSNLHSMDDSVVTKELEKEKQQNNEEIHNKDDKQPESDVSSNIEIEDIGSDSENDSVSDSFIKLDAPKDANATKTTTANTSAQTTPPQQQSLNKSNVMDFAQLSANLKAHIAEEATKNASTSIETGVAATEQVTNNTSATANETVVTNTSASTSTKTTGNEEWRAVPVYHADDNINNAVHAMMAMGFSNEGAWLTQLLESVNGNIPEALDLMSVAQRGGR